MAGWVMVQEFYKWWEHHPELLAEDALRCFASEVPMTEEEQAALSATIGIDQAELETNWKVGDIFFQVEADEHKLYIYRTFAEALAVVEGLERLFANRLSIVRHRVDEVTPRGTIARSSEITA